MGRALVPRETMQLLATMEMYLIWCWWSWVTEGGLGGACLPTFSLHFLFRIRQSSQGYPGSYINVYAMRTH